MTRESPDSCCNCGGVECMDCVGRVYHDKCENSCPDCLAKSADPRLALLLADHFAADYAAELLIELDAVDPLRHPRVVVNGEAVTDEPTLEAVIYSLGLENQRLTAELAAVRKSADAPASSVPVLGGDA